MEFVAGMFFQVMELTGFTICAWAAVRAIPETVPAEQWKRLLAWLGYAFLSIAIPSLWFNDGITMVVLCIYYLLIGRFFYFRSKMAAVCQVIYIAVMFGTQYIAIYLSAYCYRIFELEFQNYMYLISVLKILLLIPAVLVMRAVTRRRFKDSPYVKIRGMVIVPVFSMALLFLHNISSDIFLLRYGYHWMLIFSAMLIVINVYCLYFWYDVEKNGELKHRLELMEQQRELTVQYYEDLEENYSESRKIIHDIRNHLHAIERKYELEQSGYIDDVHAMLNSLGMKFYTENRMLNIILNDKLKMLPSEQVDCNLGGISLEFLSDMDITTIFANLLGNAVEAGRGKTDFFLKIRGNEIQDFTVVKITNRMYDTYREGKSSKSGHDGIGLQNVKATLEKYQGEMNICAEDGIFTVSLMFGAGQGQAGKRSGGKRSPEQKGACQENTEQGDGRG